MERLSRSILLVVPCLLCAACQRSAIDPSQSLVGAKQIPPASILSREIIEIDPRYREPGPRLIYELTPDDALTITLTDWDEKKLRQAIVAKQVFDLSSNTAAASRRLLWRLRPDKFKGIEWDTMPTGCPSPPVDESPDFTVGFIAEAPNPAPANDQVRIFDVFPSCKANTAVTARDLLKEVLAKFPHSSLPAEYERRSAPRDVVIVPQLDPPYPRHP